MAKKKISFYSLKSSKKQGLVRPIKKTLNIYKVGTEMKNEYTSIERAQGISVISGLGFETYPNFMGGIKE